MLRRLFSVVAGVILALGVLAPIALAGGTKVTLCHKPGTPAEGTLEVAASAADAHLRHGDRVGECGPAPNRRHNSRSRPSPPTAFSGRGCRPPASC